MEVLRNLGGLLFMFAIFLLFILITREVWCWYLKINSINSYLAEILKELKMLNKGR